MGIFDIFGKKKNEQKLYEKQRALDKKEIHDLDYSNIVEITKILTNNNEQAVEDMALLADDCHAFGEKYKAWCDEMLEGACEKKDISFVLAYWLTGYDSCDFINPNKFGNYIDWKEETREITAGLKEATNKLGYSLSIDNIIFTYEESTEEALKIIDKHFNNSGYTLLSQDTDSDCYHLFIAPTSKFERLVSLGKSIGIKYFNIFGQ